MDESCNSVKIWRKFEEGEQEIEQPLQSSSSLLSLLNLSQKVSNTIDISKVAEYSVASIALYEMATDCNLPPTLFLKALQHGAKPTEFLPKNNDSTIHRLASCHNYRVLEALLDLKLLTNVPSLDHHRTPLHVAILASSEVSEAQLKTIKVLCSVRPINNINAVDTDEQTASYTAFTHNQVLAYRTLLKMQASVFTNIDLYAQTVPQIGILRSIFTDSRSTLQHNLTRLLASGGGATDCYPPCLRQFLQPTYVPEFMIDYNISRLGLKWLIWHRGVQTVLVGMILFRLREELRQLRKAPSTLPVTSSTIEHDNSEEKAMTEEEIRAYDLAIARRNRFRNDHRHAKKTTLQARKEQAEQEQARRKREAINDKLEKRYEVKIAGLFGGT